jgi:tRNA (cytidine/uridine-2'-O-)-methyltransferase
MRYTPRLHIVLHEPEIPPNAGNVGRTCVAIAAKMWLVRPLGFQIDDYYLRRAGLDYWDELEWEVADSWPDLVERLAAAGAGGMWMFSARATRSYTSVAYQPGDVLVFLNNDMRVEAGFLVELLKPFGEGDVFAVSSRIEMQGHRAETGLARCFVRRGELRLLQAPGVAGDARAPMWAGGGSSAFDRRKYDAIGGFEDLYEPCYVEDVSLSWQAWRRGWRCLYAHDSVVHHAHRGTSSRVFSRARLERLNWRNTELFFVRGVTDPLLVLTHGIWFGWNLRKRARMLSLSIADGVLASLAVLPRLPMALVARQSSRRFYRRSVQSVLRVVTEPQNSPN